MNRNPVVNAYCKHEKQERFVFHQAPARENKEVEYGESQECLH